MEGWYADGGAGGGERVYAVLACRSVVQSAPALVPSDAPSAQSATLLPPRNGSEGEIQRLTQLADRTRRIVEVRYSLPVRWKQHH